MSWINQTISHYKILEKLGEGGMGVVYKARDTKLDRDVALKFLPHHITINEADKARFLQEAKAASAINHPNVCVIHDIQEHEGQQFIVMEYVDGVTLGTKIKSGQIPLKDVTNYAIQIAEALQEAHNNGIIHRDIKADNIMVNHKNQIKVMDFGLAKLKGSLKLTKSTSTVGTLSYMAPEQIQGTDIDARSDIFSFGVVLYEMLTGHLPFRGDYETAMMYSILNEEPEPVQNYRTDLSSEYLHVLNRSLEKDPEDRYQYAHEIAIDLKRVLRDSDRVSRKSIPSLSKLESEIPEAVTQKTKVKKTKSIIYVSSFAIIILAMLIAWFFKPIPKKSTEPLEIKILTSYKGRESGPSFSPDGTQIAFCWNGEDRDNYDIYAKVIGTDGYDRITDHPGKDFAPAWSPDNIYIAFVRRYQGEISICLVPSRRGGQEIELYKMQRPYWIPDELNLSWSPDSQSLVFPQRETDNRPFSLFSINIKSRKISRLTFCPENLAGDFSSAIAPNGKILAFVRYKTNAIRDIYLVPVAGGREKRITFDDRRLAGVSWTADSREIIFSSDRAGARSLWKINANGGTPEQLSVSGNPQSGVISPNGRRLAFVHDNSPVVNIYRLEIPQTRDHKAEPSLLISSNGDDGYARFSPDGKWIVFCSDRTGYEEIWISDADGKNERRLTLFEGPNVVSPRWSPDCQSIAFGCRRDSPGDIFIISKNGGIPRKITDDEYTNQGPTFSRDGKWIYMDSNRRGEQQVWKIQINGDSLKQVTTHGGHYAFESSDRERIYFHKDRQIWEKTLKSGEESLLIKGNIIWDKYSVTDNGIYYFEQTEKGWVLFYYNFSTGSSVELVNLVDFQLYGINVSPDRKWLIFDSRGKEYRESDIWLVENFR